MRKSPLLTIRLTSQEEDAEVFEVTAPVREEYFKYTDNVETALEDLAKLFLTLVSSHYGGEVVDDENE